MEAIFASKFYKASTRKDGIKAALSDPINHELVQQLHEYIDDSEWRRVKELEQQNTVQEEAVEQPTEESHGESTETSVDNDSSTPSISHSAPSSPHKSDHHLSDMLKEEEGGEEIPDQPTSEESSDTEQAVTVSESIDVDSTTIEASFLTIPSISVAKQTDSISGLLNANAETTGVRRCTMKSENELWIYYNDSINLNNVMEPVITLLNASDYSYLDFNRLARTDNAIVFSVTESPVPVEPISEDDEK